jgi:hypothetical protein
MAPYLSQVTEAGMWVDVGLARALVYPNGEDVY